MNLVLLVFCKLCCRSIARVVASLCFYVFLEKTMLKEVSSNDADWIRDLRFILVGFKTGGSRVGGPELCV